MCKQYIGYVTMPFGEKDGTNFDELYKKGIFSSLSLAVPDNRIYLFREDSPEKAPWEPSHLARIEKYRGGYSRYETQLRESIQENIVGSDFVIAVLTGQNSNVMLEVGFAQAQGKVIIYLMQDDEFEGGLLPSNLGNLKRMLPYGSVDSLKLNLYQRIQEAITFLEDKYQQSRESGGEALKYYPKRDSVGLADKFARAKERIKILTTNLTTVSANFIDPIVSAVDKNPDLEVKILTSDPENDFIDPRALQLGEDERGYRMELQGSLESISARLRRYENCEVRTYTDFPVQLWHLIDDHIYVGQSSLLRRTRLNCVFRVSTDTIGIKETYLDHFERLWKTSSPSEERIGEVNKDVAVVD